MRSLGDTPATDLLGTRQFYSAALDVNVTATDILSVTGLPSHYRVVRAWACRKTGTPDAATLALRTAAAGAGNEVIAPVALAGLAADTDIQDLTVALTTLQTAGTLYWRISITAGVAATVRLYLEIIDLS